MMKGALEQKLERGPAGALQVKKGGTAEADLSSLVARDEGFYFLNWRDWK